MNLLKNQIRKLESDIHGRRREDQRKAERVRESFVNQAMKPTSFMLVFLAGMGLAWIVIPRKVEIKRLDPNSDLKLSFIERLTATVAGLSSVFALIGIVHKLVDKK